MQAIFFLQISGKFGYVKSLMAMNKITGMVLAVITISRTLCFTFSEEGNFLLFFHPTGVLASVTSYLALIIACGCQNDVDTNIDQVTGRNCNLKVSPIILFLHD